MIKIANFRLEIYGGFKLPLTGWESASIDLRAAAVNSRMDGHIIFGGKLFAAHCAEKRSLERVRSLVSP